MARPATKDDLRKAASQKYASLNSLMASLTPLELETVGNTI